MHLVIISIPQLHMKKLLISFSATIFTLTSCQIQAPDYHGSWYSVNHHAVMSVELRTDGIASFSNEASSSLCFSGQYTIANSGDTLFIDLPQTTSGMAASGIMRQNKDYTLDLCFNFGAPGLTERPTTFEATPGVLTMMSFHCSRDKESVTNQAYGIIKAPKDATLAFERNRRLGHGINIESTVDGHERPEFFMSGYNITDDIRSIVEAGFNSVRLPVNFYKHCSSQPPYTIDADFFRVVDDIIFNCNKEQLPVVLDMHYYPNISFAGQDPSVSYEDNIIRLESLWTQIAEHYKGISDDMLYFDLLNEPTLEFGAARWNDEVARLINIIRPINPGRTLMVMTPELGQNWTINYLDLPEEENNLIIEYHYYLPHLFTHQGLAFAMAENSHQIPWMGTSEEKAAVDADLDYIENWSKTHNRPVNMGEFGVVNTADHESRVRWICYLYEAAHKRGISSHQWSLRDDFGIRNNQTGVWDEDIINAIKPTLHTK